ncbi:MAG: hypothetical protein KBD62_35950 [Kofleriaceae bacterium]|nr:hypothetical protein [Kofleriaceae bacterium]
MKFSKQVREEAAVLCMISAGTQYSISGAANAIDALPESEALAVRTRMDVSAWAWRARAAWSMDYDATCIEAAALLRDGWSPGDPIVPWKVPT